MKFELSKDSISSLTTHIQDWLNGTFVKLELEDKGVTEHDISAGSLAKTIEGVIGGILLIRQLEKPEENA